MKNQLIPLAVFSLLLLYVVAADPTGVSSVNRGASERGPDTAGLAEPSEAGNVTPLLVNGGAITQRWQGYFGNVTGTVRLQDASGNSLYDWGLANPDGEIFAANHSVVTWSNIFCVNFSAPAELERLNRSSLNQFIGYGPDDNLGKLDTVNATFNQTFGDAGETLAIGSTTINNADNCSMVTLNDNNGYQTNSFKQVLLTDNLSVVFAAILEQDTTAFNNIPADFEMIVGVNGTDLYNTRDYYFFAELS